MFHVFGRWVGWVGVLVVAMGTARAQGPVGYGDWQLHLPTNHPLHVADADDRVYVATENTFYFLDKKQNTTQVLSRRDGLNDVGVTALAYDSVTQQTVLAYRNANIDIVRSDGSIRNLNDILRKSVQGAKNINHISVGGGKALLATSFGLVLVDLTKLEISDTYSNIGPGGAPVVVYDAAVANGFLFAATSAGLLRGALANNLLDYRNWTQFLPVPLAPGQPVYPFLATYNGQVYAAVHGSGSAVYRYVPGSPGTWQQVPNTYSGQFRSLRAGSGGVLLVDDLSGVRRLDRNNVVSVAAPPTPGDQTLDAVRSGRDGSYYVANYGLGLRRVRAGQATERYVANGPERSESFGLAVDARTNTVDVFTGGFSERYQPFGSRLGFYEYANGQWTNFTRNALPSATDFPDPLNSSRGARATGGALYVATFGDGLLEWQGSGRFRRFTSTAAGVPGSPILAFAGPGNDRIADVVAAADGSVWLTNPHGAPNRSGLYNYAPETNTWTVAPWVPNFENLDRLALDDAGLVWASVARKPNNPSLPAQTDGGLFAVNPSPTSASPPRFFSKADGLPENQIYDLAKDRRGYMWVATIKGVGVFSDPRGPFEAGTVFTLPDVRRGEGKGFPALFTEAVRTVAVDGGDRKWFGTDHGLWLFSPDADEALLHFTTANSPLPSDRIVSVRVNDKTGDVWVATDAGVVSYRGAATVTEGEPHCTAVFPNPVRPEFAGMVGITGLANNAVVKITDVAGHLVYATKANGGTVTWNLTNADGQRVRSGIYLVLSADADGQNGCVSKVAVLSK